MKLFLVVVGVLFIILVATRSQQTITNTPSLSPIKALATVEEVEASSVDGTAKLIMKSELQPDGSTTYSFIIPPSGDKPARTLLTKTLAKTSSMVLPQNSWAPDNTYVFVQENEPGLTHFWVLKASGEAFADGAQAVDAAGLFAEKQPSLRLKNVTGWDAPGLLHVTTTTDQGAKSPSFWFVIDTHSFLQLAH